MTTTKNIEVMAVGNVEFFVILKESANLMIAAWQDDIKRRYPNVEYLDVDDWYRNPAGYNIYTVKVTMHEDADFEQICAIRTELKAGVTVSAWEL